MSLYPTEGQWVRKQMEDVTVDENGLYHHFDHPPMTKEALERTLKEEYPACGMLHIDWEWTRPPTEERWVKRIFSHCYPEENGMYLTNEGAEVTKEQMIEILKAKYWEIKPEQDKIRPWPPLE